MSSSSSLSSANALSASSEPSAALLIATTGERASRWRRLLAWLRRLDRPFASPTEAAAYNDKLERLRANAAYRIPFL